MTAFQLGHPCNGGLLQHKVQFIGPVAPYGKDAVVLHQLWPLRHAEAYHVGIRYLRHLRRGDKHVARSNKRAQPLGSLPHNTLKEARLQVKQRQSPFALIWRQGNKHLAARRIRRYAPAAAPGVDDKETPSPPPP